jgi:hypothetical protein
MWFPWVGKLSGQKYTEARTGGGDQDNTKNIEGLELSRTGGGNQDNTKNIEGLELYRTRGGDQDKTKNIEGLVTGFCLQRS